MREGRCPVKSQQKDETHEAMVELISAINSVQAKSISCGRPARGIDKRYSRNKHYNQRIPLPSPSPPRHKLQPLLRITWGSRHCRPCVSRRRQCVVIFLRTVGSHSVVGRMCALSRCSCRIGEWKEGQGTIKLDRCSRTCTMVMK